MVWGVWLAVFFCREGCSSQLLAKLLSPNAMGICLLGEGTAWLPWHGFFLAMCGYLINQFRLGLDFFAVLCINLSWSFGSRYNLWLLIMHEKFRQVYIMHPVGETMHLCSPHHFYCVCSYPSKVCSYPVGILNLLYVLRCMLAYCLILLFSFPPCPVLHAHMWTHTESVQSFQSKNTCFPS